MKTRELNMTVLVSQTDWKKTITTIHQIEEREKKKQQQKIRNKTIKN